MKVLNIASFVPIQGLLPENDITLKIYAELNNRYKVESEFIKPAPNIPNWAACLKKSLRKRKKIFNNKNYLDPKTGIKIHFFKHQFPLENKIPFKFRHLLSLQYEIYGKDLDKIKGQFKPDCIHAHSLFPDGYYAMRLSEKYKVPYILTIRGVSSGEYFNYPGKQIMQKASNITTPSYTLYESLRSRYDVELLAHGINEEWYSNNTSTWDDGHIQLITVSRLLKMKNIQHVIRVVKRLTSSGYKVSFDIIGDGDYRDTLESLVEELQLSNFVTFHGYRDPVHIRKVMQKCNIFVMLSFPETFGRSYFEAAAQGLFIIGIANTGAFGHFSPEEAEFLDRNADLEEQLFEQLTAINTAKYEETVKLSHTKSKNFKNSEILERYYQILNMTKQNYH